MSEPSVPEPGARRGTLLPLRLGRGGRYHDSAQTIGPGIDVEVQAELRSLLDRRVRDGSWVRQGKTAEMAGRLYRTQLYISAREPGTAYAEVSEEYVPVDAPAAHAPVGELFGQYIRDLRAHCATSDALTHDTRISLETTFVAPRFHRAGPNVPVPEAEVSWAELGDHARVIISGPAGAGKTSCLRRLVLDLISDDQADTLPILMELRHFGRGELSIDAIQRHVNAEHGPDLTRELAPPLHGGRVLLAIDGLDELADPDDQGKVLEGLADVCAALPCVRVILTTRESIGPDRLDDFARLQLRPFLPAQVQQWTRHYLRGHSSAHSRWAEFIDLAHYDERFSLLVSNPLLLSLAASLHWNYPHELNSWRGLLDKSIDALIHDWDAVRGIGRWRQSGVTPLQIRKLLDRISGSLPREQWPRFARQQFDEAYLVTGVRDEGAKAPVLLRACLTTGLITQDGPDRYRFAHPSFADFFAASDVVTRTDGVSEQIQDASKEPDGRDFWQLSCALTSDAGTLLRSVLESSVPPGGQEEAAGASSRRVDPEAAAFMIAQAIGEEVSATDSVVRECCAYVVTALEDRLREAGLVSQAAAGAVWPASGDREIAWSRGAQAGDAVTTAESLQTSARLLGLLYRARHARAGRFIKAALTDSTVPLLREAGLEFEKDGWWDYDIRTEDSRAVLYVAITKAAATETERPVTRPALLSKPDDW